jgi:acyl carrier protein
MALAIDQDTICQKLCEFIQANLVAPGVGVNPGTSLTQLGLDSFSIIEIVLFIERQYGLTLPDVALSKENIESPQAFAACVHHYISL